MVFVEGDVESGKFTDGDLGVVVGVEEEVGADWSGEGEECCERGCEATSDSIEFEGGVSEAWHSGVSRVRQLWRSTRVEA